MRLVLQPRREESIAGVRMFAWTLSGLFAFITTTLIVAELLLGRGGWTSAEYVRRIVEVIALIMLAAGIQLRVGAAGSTRREREIMAMIFFLLNVGLAAYYSARYLSFDVARMAPTWVSPIVFLFPLLVPGWVGLYVRAVVFAAVVTPVVFAFYSATVGHSVFSSQVALTSVVLTTVGVWVSCGLALTIGSLRMRLRNRLAEVEKERDEAHHALESYGSYELDSRIGQGGMGEVWVGRHKLLKRPAAIKLIRPRQNSSDSDIVSKERAFDEAIARFEREATAIAMLSSPNTVQLYDFGRTDTGTFFFAMELLNGLDLDDYVRTYGPMSQPRVIYLLKQACNSLAEAHDAGLVHRDIKPKNLFMCRAGIRFDVLKVLDFGLVFDVDGARSPEAVNLTADGEVCGTPAYMSPEQARRQAIDHRSDIYSLGAVAYYLLTGTPVFRATNPIELIVAHVQEAPEPPSQRAPQLGIRPALDDIVLRCLAKDRERRFASVWELYDALEAVSFVEPWSQPSAKEWSQDHPSVYAQAPPSPFALRKPGSVRQNGSRATGQATPGVANGCDT